MTTIYAQNTSVTAKIAPHRGIVQYDYMLAYNEIIKI